jgi:hypothetical protein
MSFRIHAAGTRGFRYTRDNCIDEGDIESAQVIATMQSIEPSVGSLVEVAADQVTPSVSVTDGATAVGRMTLTGLLRNAVDSLGLYAQARDGWIAVSARQVNTLWADTSSFARYEFFPGDSPGAEFIRNIMPALTAADLNDMGVFRAMARALDLYDVHLNGSGRPRILIQLSK